MISYAQNFEDVLLWRCLKDVANGTYVDVGAHHPELDSVTAWFYGQGWNGINVEPIPTLLENFATARPRDTNLAVAAGASCGEAILHVFPESLGLSTVNPDVAGAASFASQPLCVPVVPLRDILARLDDKPIHFLKIDVEGAERDVLDGMDFARYRPWVVVIEAAPPNNIGPTGPRWDDLILPYGYVEAWSDGLNRYFVASEHADRVATLAHPANVFDGFELAVTLRERTARIAAEAAQGELRAAVALRDDRVAELGAALDASLAESDQRRRRIEELDAMVVTRDRRVNELDRLVADGDAHLAERDARIRDERREASATIAQLQRELAFKQEVIDLLHDEAAGWQSEINDATDRLADARDHAFLAQARVAGLEQSVSWRMTAPVRWSAVTLRRAGRSAPGGTSPPTT